MRRKIQTTNNAGADAVTYAKARDGLYWYFRRYGIDESRFGWQIEPLGGKLEIKYGSKVKIYRVPAAPLLEHVPDDPAWGYRGMSWEEWKFIRIEKRIESLYAHNLGEEQTGFTFFGKASQAESYASGFAPLPYLPAFRRPGVVVAVPRELLLTHKDRPKAIPGSELAAFGALPASVIGGVWYLIPNRIRFGALDIVLDLLSNVTRWTDGSRHNPSVSYIVYHEASHAT